MARRRLGPPGFIADLPAEPLPGALAPSSGPGRSLDRAEPPLSPAAEPFSPRAGVRPPIAAIAGQSAAEAALQDLAADLARARDEGRLVQDLALEAIDESHLVRDRIALDGDELEALKASLRDRGQQMPIEVVDLGQGRYGLISGWRRLTALRQLAAEDPARFGKVLALLRRPSGSAEAYRAMVEENEIRVGLSYYERARIAARAVAQGVFADSFAALAGLFPTASRAKRSKIGSFIRLYEALDDVLRFPAAIPERLGLDLAKRLESPEDLARLRAALAKAAPADAAAELALLTGLAVGEPRPAGAQDALVPPPLTASLAEAAPEAAPETPSAASSAKAVHLAFGKGKVTLSGAGVDADFIADLKLWLAARGGSKG